jgi:multiple sugar transport system substrate-binding protein
MFNGGNKMKNTKFLVLGLIPLALGLLASCGGTKDPDDGGDNTDLTQLKASISFQTTMGKDNQASVNRCIEEFNKTYPNISVELSIYSGTYSALANDITSKFATDNYPDMAMVYPDAVADFIDYGKAVKLDDFMSNAEYGWTEADLADIYSAYIKEGQQYTVEGTYSMPLCKSTEVVFYDKGKINGLTLTGVNGGNAINETYLNSLTWEEFFDVFCPALMTQRPELVNTSNGAGQYAVLGYDSDANFFITLAEQYGYDYTSIVNGEGSCDFNNADMKGLVKKVNQYAQKGYVLTQAGTGKRANSYFTDGSCLFSIGSTAGAKFQFSDTNPLDIGVFQIPHAGAGAKKSANILQGPSMSFLSHPKSDGKGVDTDRTLASWLFYKFFTDTKWNTDWTLTANYNPIRASVANSADFKEANSTDDKTLKSLSMLTARINTFIPSISDDYYTSPAFKGSNACRDEVDTIIGNATKYTGTNATDTQIDTWFKTAYDASIKAMR